MKHSRWDEASKKRIKPPKVSGKVVTGSSRYVPVYAVVYMGYTTGPEICSDCGKQIFDSPVEAHRALHEWRDWCKHSSEDPENYVLVRTYALKEDVVWPS